jgi:hypothetical protein
MTPLNLRFFKPLSNLVYDMCFTLVVVVETWRIDEDYLAIIDGNWDDFRRTL